MLIAIVIISIQHIVIRNKNSKIELLESRVYEDTIIHHTYDTTKVVVPIYHDSINIKYDTLLYIDTTTAIRDTFYISVPITQKSYKDSTYSCWVSGYKPNLDSIEVYNKIIYRDIIQKPLIKRLYIEGQIIPLFPYAGYSIGLGYEKNKYGISLQYGRFYAPNINTSIIDNKVNTITIGVRYNFLKF